MNGSYRYVTRQGGIVVIVLFAELLVEHWKQVGARFGVALD